jgi:KDO2-lipid IV(A) lauroyltransferase
MAKPRSRTTDYAFFTIVRLAVCLVQTLPDATAHALGGILGWLAYRIDRRHRTVVQENLREAFPETNDATREHWAVGSFRHFVSILMEVARIPRKLHATNWQKYGDLSEAGPLLDILRSGRPVMLVMGHFGNWEIALYGLGLLGFRVHAIARPLDNPYLDRYIRNFRERTGQTMLAKTGDVTRIMEVLEAGGTIATLADQDAGPRGQFVEFFGRPASTHKPISLLAMKFNAVIVVCGVMKVGEPMRYKVVVGDVIDTLDYFGPVNAGPSITQRYTTALENLIRRDPAQYFWMHRRWKNQPKVSMRRAA